VANAIKEIITATRQYSPHTEKAHQEVSEPATIPQKRKKTTIIVASVIALALIVLGILFVPKLFKQSMEIEKSIAVLPFIDDSPDSNNSHIINGVMEEILINLQKIKELRVISRNSVEQYRGNTKPTTPEIAKNLGVNYIVEGSGQKYGNTIRLRVQLINILKGKEKHIWGESYEKEINESKDYFAIQSQVAQSIAKELQTIISTEEKELIEEIPTKNFNAYEYYLLGKYRLKNRIRDDDSWKAIEYFQRAVDLDTTFALAYSGLADAYYQLVNYAIASPREAYLEAKANSIKALELNEGLAYAHCLLGVIKLSYEYDISGSETEYIRALEIDPRSVETHICYARLLSISGRHKEAMSHADLALEIDPLYYATIDTKAWILFNAGYKDEAIKLLTDTRDLHPSNPIIYWRLANFYTHLEKYEEALSALVTQLTLMENDNISDEIGLQGFLYGRMHQNDEAQKQLSRLDELSIKGYYVSPRTRIWVYLGLDNVDEAIKIIEEAYDMHTITPSDLLMYPYESFKNDPRYDNYVKKVGLGKNYIPAE